ELSIAATLEDNLKITMIDQSNNITELAHKPFESEDGTRVLMDERGGEFINIQGMGIKVEPGTFTGKVNVGIAQITDTNTIAPLPLDMGYESLNAMNVDFSGQTPNKPFKLSFPAPAGVTVDDPFFMARQVDVLGEKKWMVIDTASLKNGRIEVNSPPFPGCTSEGIYRTMKNSSYAMAFMTGTATSVPAVVAAMDLVYLVDLGNPDFIIPVPIRPTDEKIHVDVKDLITGETLYQTESPALTQEGQVYNFGKVSNDIEPPAIIQSTGILCYSFSVSAGKENSKGVTITPQVSNGEVSSILIEADPGTTVVLDGSDPDAPKGRVGVYKLVKEGQGPDEKWQYKEIKTIDAIDDGSFSGTVDAKTGEKIILTIETDDIDLNREFILTFSEPVAEVDAKDSRFSLQEEGPDPELDIYTQSLPTQTRVSIKPGRQLEEGKRYTLELKDYPDLAGNTISLKTFFRTKKSGVMG
ncbi:MAG: Ig-like domain-containing protein, partial [bacterium]|nr:Ig-like domain-containing protein [bacterium]